MKREIIFIDEETLTAEELAMILGRGSEELEVGSGEETKE